jgi:hypothetical protein
MGTHGFTANQLSNLVLLGFARRTAERVVGGVGQTFEVTTFKITEDGERALGYER